jgi:predicted nucleic acid-binding protein
VHDAGVLIYSTVPAHPLGEPVARLLEQPPATTVCIGSVLLVPELLIKPIRFSNRAERRALVAGLSNLQLIPVDGPVAEMAAALGATYGLKALNAIHLACAVHAGADAFVTNNRKDFDEADILEL